MNRKNFFFPYELKPEGWLKNQLLTQAKGLCGNLDKIWPDVRDSAWIGGDREGWERVPYWLDGFVPMAYLLEDEDLIIRAQKYIDAIISRQKADGWICPCADDKRKEYDTWAVLLIAKVLKVYYDCSADERIPSVLYNALKNYYELLKSGEITLFNWGKMRWFEGFIAIQFVYDVYKEDWALDLAKILKEQGADFCALEEHWKRPLNKWSFETHVVNMAMMLKAEAVSHNLLGEEYLDKAEKWYQILSEYNGTPTGSFTGDECLSGLSAIQGTELCSIVEQMYSYELLYAHTGDDKWAERLEKLAFNALPATISDDMWTHQYVQQSNQIACQKFPGKSIFRTNNEEAHLFGLEPHFGCCTSNFGQGWPKFALSAFLYDDEGIECAYLLPTTLKTKDVFINLETDYPFRNIAKFTLESKKDFVFTVRIPSFAENLKVCGESVENPGVLKISINAGDKKEIVISFDVVPKLISRPNGMRSAVCGSLVFSLPIKYNKKMHEYEKNGVERKFPYCDYELIPASDWNMAFCSDDLKIEQKQMGEVPFSSENPPLVLWADMKKINWDYEDGYETVCSKIPKSLSPISDKERIALVPYGSAKLRMTEMPLL